MENRLPGIGNGNDGRSLRLYDFEVGISNYQSHFQVEGDYQLPNQPLCTFGKETEEKCYDNNTLPAYDQGNLPLFYPEYVPNIVTDSGQATASNNAGVWGLLDSQGTNELSSTKNGLDITWSTKESSISKSSLQSLTQNIFGPPYDELLPTPSDEKRYQDWAIEIPYPLFPDPSNVANTTSSAKYRDFPLGPRPNIRPHKNPRTTTVSSPGSPKRSPTSLIPGPSPSSLDATPNFTLAAHRAVTELFPELADTCNFEAKRTALHQEIPGYQDARAPKRLIATKADNTENPVLSLGLSETNITKGPIKRKRSLHSNLEYLEKLPLPGSIPPKMTPGLDEREKISEHRKLGIPPRSQTTPFALPSPIFTITAQSLKAEQLSQLSSDLVNLGLKNSCYSHPPGIEGEISCPAVTISPRCLSKLQLPLMSPKQDVFDIEEGYYVSKVVLCDEGESVAEKDMPGVLDIETKQNFSRLDNSGSRPPSPSPVKSPATSPLKDPLPPSIAVLNSCSFNPSPPVPTGRDAAQCSISSPEGPPHSPHQKSRAKGTSRNRTIKNNSKEFLREQNQLLLRWRSQGISYKTIKERLGIDEAESTLRGRLRTLTKPKSERLRKPQWTKEDIVLLLEAVDPALLNVKWKQVSETIVALGGSYKFGPSTCKKQYVKLVANGRARPLAECALEKISKTDFEAGNLGIVIK